MMTTALPLPSVQTVSFFTMNYRVFIYILGVKSRENSKIDQNVIG